MIKHKFNKGDLVWANLRGYGVVLEALDKRLEDSQLDQVGICDYADNSMARQFARVSDQSLSWFNGLGKNSCKSKGRIILEWDTRSIIQMVIF